VLRFRNQRWAERVGLGQLDAPEWEAHLARFAPRPRHLAKIGTQALVVLGAYLARAPLAALLFFGRAAPRRFLLPLRLGLRLVVPTLVLRFGGEEHRPELPIERAGLRV